MSAVIETSNPSAAYRQWLLKSNVSDSGRWIADWIRDALECFHEAPITVLAQHLGISHDTVERICSGGLHCLDAGAVDKLAILLRRQQQLDELREQPGVEGWSELGRYCGDGAADFGDGCGSFFHAHHADALCRDCHGIKEGTITGPPRDVRLADRYTRKASRSPRAAA